MAMKDTEIISSLKKIVDSVGVGVFANHARANALISDYFPGYENEKTRKLIKSIISVDAFVKISSASNNDLGGVYKTLKTLLVDGESLSEDSAKMAIGWVCSSMGRKAPQFSNTNPTKSNNIQSTSSNLSNHGISSSHQIQPTPQNTNNNIVDNQYGQYGIDPNYGVKHRRNVPKPLIICVIVFLIASIGSLGVITLINNNKIDTVETLISALPDDENYYLDYQAEIVDAYAAYMELDEKLQSKVENADKLMSVMDGLKVAEAYEQRQNMQFTKLDGGGYSVKLKEGANSKISGELVVPGVYRQEPVVAIEDYAFENCRSITSVVVPDSITTIGSGAFKGCSNLQTMKLPFTGKSKSASAFEAVFGYIFGYSVQTKDYNHDNTITFVNSKVGNVDGATWQYSSYNYSSSYYSNKLQSYYYYIPTSIKTVTITNQDIIVAGAFNGCKTLTQIEYLQELSEIGSASFQNCESLTCFNSATIGELNLTGNYSNIGSHAFKNCSKINQVIIADSAVAIGEYAFENLSISELTIPNSVESIYVGALHKCEKLTTLKTPFVGKSSSANAYEGVLGFIFGYATQVQDHSHDYSTAFVNSNVGSMEGSIWQYSCYNYSSSYYGNKLQSYYYYIPNSLTTVIVTLQDEVPIAAFNGCKNIEKIQFDNTLKKIGNAAMQNCSQLSYFNSDQLKTINLTGNIDTIGDYAFSNCKIVENLLFSSNRTIGNHAFDGCVNVLELNLNDNIHFIGDYAFKDISIPTVVKVFDSTEKIGLGAFQGCISLEDITIPFTGRSVDSTAYEAVFGYIFGYSTQTKDYSHNKTTTFVNSQVSNVDGAIWQYSCYNYSSSYYSNKLQSYFYYIPSSIEKVTITKQEVIQIAAFNGCKNLLSVTFTKNIRDIGIAAFQNCSALQSFNSNSIGTLNLSGNYSNIGAYAFKNCSTINNVLISDSTISIGEYAFENLSIIELIIPDSVETIYIGALHKCNKLTTLKMPFVGKSNSATAYEAVLGFIFGYTTQTKDYSHDITTTFVNTRIGNVDNAIWQYSCYNYSSSYFSNKLQSYYYYIPSTLQEITITKQKNVPIAAFKECTMLETIAFEQGISTQGEAAFQNCSATVIKGN